MTPTEQALIISAKNIAKYCRNHVCTDCPLNIGNKHEGLIKAHCVCDYNILHLPSTWKIEDLKEEEK